MIKQLSILIALLFISNIAFSQLSQPAELSKQKKLSLSAYTVFSTNKFLDFKGVDTVKLYADDVLIDSYQPDKFFGYKKDWDKIEREDTSTYRKPGDRYKYTYTDSSMIEEYTHHGAYGVHRDKKTIYNAKGYITNYEEKVFLEENLKEIHTTTNVFDKQNRVVKIVSKDQYAQNSISAEYRENEVLINSKDGTVKVVLVKNN